MITLINLILKFKCWKASFLSLHDLNVKDQITLLYAILLINMQFSRKALNMH